MSAPGIAVVGEGVIQNMGMLDLRGSSNEDIARIKSIENVACIIVPISRQGALANVPKKNVAITIPVPDGANVRMHVGQLNITGESLETVNDPDAIFIIVGQVLISSPVKKIGYKHLQVVGQILAPKGSEAALTQGITSLTGQIIYYSGNARFFLGNETFSREFLEFADKPMTMVMVGNFEFARDVTVDVLKKHVSEIFLIGNLKAPKALIPCVQYLCREKTGNIGESHA